MAGDSPIKVQPVPFRFHPRVFASLGADLVTSDLVAVIELVKNCYDAFATRVDVRFKTGADGKLSLEIEDDGAGMTDDTIRDVWCVVATPFREKNTTSASGEKQRRVSGAKGLGRLSAARLGEAMEVITRKKGGKCWKVDVSWGRLAESDSMESCYAYLGVGDETQLSNKVGTLVRIKGLHGKWSEEMVADLEEGLSRLKPPFDKLGDFKIYITPPGENERATEIEPSNLINSPTYLIKGSYGADGSLKYDYRFEGLDGKTRKARESQNWQTVKEDIKRHRDWHQPTGATPTSGPFEFEIRVWDLDEASMKKASERFDLKRSKIREQIRAFKGLSVYRDQILVLPKSETARDWLGLDLRRVSKVGTRISTTQIVGFVSISGDANPKVLDTSDRERFVQNEAAGDFVVLLYHVIEALEMERDRDREIQQPKATDIFSGISASDVASEARRRAADGADAGEVVTLIEDFERKLDDTKKKVEEHFTYYSRVAALGTVAAWLVHEIGNRCLGINSFLNEVQTYLKDPSKGTAELLKKHDYAQQALSYLNRVATTFYPLAGRSFRRGARTASVTAVLDMCKIPYEETLAKRKIEWVQNLRGNDEVAIDPGELHTVFHNLIDNALYWTARKDDGRREIRIETRHSSITNRLDVLVHDSGIGIREEDKNWILEIGHSRRPGGMGMGLTIAGEIIGDHDGKLGVVTKGPLGGATFQFTLPLKK
jgi:signal transduction histidine kinase